MIHEIVEASTMVGSKFCIGDNWSIQEFNEILAKDTKNVGGFLSNEFFMNRSDGDAVTLE
jgi:hypothetical protein